MWRKYTSKLNGTEDIKVLQWLDGAMDLHYKGQVYNPLWDDGKALKEMWEKYIGEDLPIDDRCMNLVEGAPIQEEYSLGATHTSTTSSAGPYGQGDRLPKSTPAKRSPSSDNDHLHTTPPSSKRSRPSEYP